MPKRLSLILVAFGCIVALAGGPALAGVDQGFPKADGKQSWGEIFSWVFGGDDIGKAHALIIGISKYQGFKNLDETAGDPERMRRFLLDEAGFDYVHVLTDEKVTLDRVRTLIQDDFRRLVGPNDRFVLYWSGHGIPVEGRSRQLGYLPLNGSTPESIASMLPMRDVLSWTDIINAKQALHVVDTCFSGLARLPETQAARRDLTVELLNKPARHLLTATTGAGQTIASREWAGGIFTDAFIAGASGDADRSGDGVVNMLELEDFVRDRVNAKRSFAEWPDEIKPKSYDLQDNEGEFFFVTAAKKREVAHVDESVAIEGGMPVVVLGPGESAPADVRCDAEADRLFWDSVKDKTEPAFFEAYLERVESGELCGQFSALARLELDQLTQEPAAGPAERPAALPRERVIQIQEMLAELGFDPGSIDGDFGPRTRSAVIEFQRSIGAAATGSITEADEVALATAYADRRAQQRSIAGTESSGQGAGSTGGGFGTYEPGSTFRDCPDCPEMVVIPAGSFMMGSPASEEGRDDDEGPQREVTIASPFAIGKFEVTFEAYDRFAEATGREQPDDRGWGRGDRPVINVSWEDAQQYVGWLSEETGQRYRLPSESEWEYAARAGTTTPFWMGSTISTSEANYDGNYVYGNGQKGEYRQRTVPVGSFSANPFGLHDVHGNVWEWVEDRWHDSYEGAPQDGSPWLEGNNSARVLRGGSWSGFPRYLRSAHRIRIEPAVRIIIDGFRVARTLTP